MLDCAIRVLGLWLTISWKMPGKEKFVGGTFDVIGIRIQASRLLEE